MRFQLILRKLEELETLDLHVHMAAIDSSKVELIPSVE